MGGGEGGLGLTGSEPNWVGPNIVGLTTCDAVVLRLSLIASCLLDLSLSDYIADQSVMNCLPQPLVVITSL